MQLNHKIKELHSKCLLFLSVESLFDSNRMIKSTQFIQSNLWCFVCDECKDCSYAQNEG